MQYSECAVIIECLSSISQEVPDTGFQPPPIRTDLLLEPPSRLRDRHPRINPYFKLKNETRNIRNHISFPRSDLYIQVKLLDTNTAVHCSALNCTAVNVHFNSRNSVVYVVCKDCTHAVFKPPEIF